jgi:hypothetical protein
MQFMTYLDTFHGNLMQREIHLGHIRCYETDWWFTLKCVLIYAILVQVLRLNPLEPEPRNVVHTRFSRRNSGTIRRNETYQQFTLKFVPIYAEIRPSQDPHMIRRTRFSCRNFRSHHCYETTLQFTLEFILIYVILVHVLRWNP